MQFPLSRLKFWAIQIGSQITTRAVETVVVWHQMLDHAVQGYSWPTSMRWRTSLSRNYMKRQSWTKNWRKRTKDPSRKVSFDRVWTYVCCWLFFSVTFGSDCLKVFTLRFVKVASVEVAEVQRRTNLFGSLLKMTGLIRLKNSMPKQHNYAVSMPIMYF